jgi:hypothetical protein
LVLSFLINLVKSLEVLTTELKRRDLEINQGKFEAFESLFVERKRELSLFLISFNSRSSFLCACARE